MQFYFTVSVFSQFAKTFSHVYKSSIKTNFTTTSFYFVIYLCLLFIFSISALKFFIVHIFYYFYLLILYLTSNYLKYNNKNSRNLVLNVNMCNDNILICLRVNML